MTKPIVIRLQEDALDPDVTVADLLRKAKLIASKLNLTEASEWIEHELTGYPVGAKLPDYRNLVGQPKALDPFQGWVPMLFTGNDEMQRIVSSRSRLAGRQLRELSR